MAWLVEHASYLLNTFELGTDGRTAYGRLHGKEGTEHICEFGERVLWYVSNKLRTKLDARWRYGTFFGRSMNSDQNLIGLNDGSVTCARAMLRVIPSLRWDTNKVGNISGAPTDMKIQHIDNIEQEADPHIHPDPKSR